MRISLIIAIFLVVVSLLWKSAKGKPPEGKTLFSWAFIFIILSILAQTELQTLSDIFSWLIIVIIALNDGYDMVREL